MPRQEIKLPDYQLTAICASIILTAGNPVVPLKVRESIAMESAKRIVKRSKDTV